MITKYQKTLGLAVIFALAAPVVHAQKNGPGSNGAENGRPFQSLQEQIDASNAALDALAANNDASILAIQAEIDVLQSEIDSLQSQIDNNAGDIDALEAELDALSAELAQKQDVLNGSCSPGTSLRVINPDGSFLCEYDDQGSGTLYVPRVVAYGAFSWFGNYYYSEYGYSTAMCPNDWRATGGGGLMMYQGSSGYSGALSDSSPWGNGWRVTATMADDYVYGYNAVRAVVNCEPIYQ